MAWCDECDRYLTPTSLDPDGTCPSCDSGTVLVEPTEASPPVAQRKAPWHFKLMAGLTFLYLAWRLVDLVRWLF